MIGARGRGAGKEPFCLTFLLKIKSFRSYITSSLQPCQGVQAMPFKTQKPDIRTSDFERDMVKSRLTKHTLDLMIRFSRRCPPQPDAAGW